MEEDVAMNLEGSVSSGYCFGVLARDFRATYDEERLGEDWRAWVIAELRCCDCVIARDGDGFLGYGYMREDFGDGGYGPVTPAGQALVRISFLTVEQLAAIYAASGREGHVQREHPWYRTKRYLGYVLLECLAGSFDVRSRRYGELLAGRCLGRIIAPGAVRVADPLRPATYRLSDLLLEYHGFRDAGFYGSHEGDAEEFFAPIVDEVNQTLRRLGIGTRARTFDMSQGTARGWTPIGFAHGDDLRLVDLDGRQIDPPALLLAGESIEIWRLQEDPFGIADGSRPDFEEEEQRRARERPWIGWELLSALNAMDLPDGCAVVLGLVFVLILLAVGWCRG